MKLSPKLDLDRSVIGAIQAASKRRKMSVTAYIAIVLEEHAATLPLTDVQQKLLAVGDALTTPVPEPKLVDAAELFSKAKTSGVKNKGQLYDPETGLFHVDADGGVD